MLRLNQKEDETVTPTPDVDLFAHGHRAFEDGDYEAAADLLRRYLNQHTTGSVPAARKYLGYSLCILERYAEGALELEFVAESE
jgi:outer membrane protein assembly factor BamD (BamD/ComL family)